MRLAIKYLYHRRLPLMKYCLPRLFLLLLVLSACVQPLLAQSKDERYQPRKDTTAVPKQPYERYFTRDRFDREITFYISETGSHREPLPLVVFIQGSGCSSLFVRQNG